MKRFSVYLNEGCTTSDVNPGNLYSNTGVMNHLTPVGNIVTQVRNLFTPLTGIVASVGEDGFSVKLNSSKFTTKEEVNSVLYDTTIMRGTTLASYITSQGLEHMKIIPIGQFFVVYFCPSDIKGAVPGQEPEPSKFPCTEMQQYDIEEVEMVSLNENFDDSLVVESDDDEEMEDLTHKKVVELITSKDKVKAAKQFELLITQEIELPRDYYFAGVKSKDGDESIALRWKYTKKRPHGKTTEMTRSLMNIFDTSKEGIWVQDFDKDSYFNLPEEVKKLIENILDFIGAKKTNNPSVWSLEDVKDEDEEGKDKDEKDENDSKEDSSEDKDEKKEEKSEDNKEEKSDDEDKKEDDKLEL